MDLSFRARRLPTERETINQAAPSTNYEHGQRTARQTAHAHLSGGAGGVRPGAQPRPAGPQERPGSIRPRRTFPQPAPHDPQPQGGGPVRQRERAARGLPSSGGDPGESARRRPALEFRPVRPAVHRHRRHRGSGHAAARGERPGRLAVGRVGPPAHGFCRRPGSTCKPPIPGSGGGGANPAADPGTCSSQPGRTRE